MPTEIPHRNWAGNVVYGAPNRAAPRSVEELQEVVVSHDRVKAAGTGHSFNDSADTDGVQVSLSAMPGEMWLDEATGVVSAPGGATYAQALAFLHERGRTLRNLASLPHISLAGAVQTGTHGSGVGNPALSGDVVAVHLVDAAGEERAVRQGDPDFDAVVVGLGAFGVVHRVELRTVPSFDVEQRVYEGLGWGSFLPSFEQVMGCGYSVSAFTRYESHGVDQVWVKQVDRPDGDRTAALLHGLGAREASETLHMLPGVPADHVTAQLGERGPSHERLAHFRAEFQPSHGDEIQSEYFLDAVRAVEGIEALRVLGPRFGALLHVAEIRRIAADSAWLSPSGGRDSVALHFTWRLDVEGVGAVLPRGGGRAASARGTAALGQGVHVRGRRPAARVPAARRVRRRRGPLGPRRAVPQPVPG